MNLELGFSLVFSCWSFAASPSLAKIFSLCGAGLPNMGLNFSRANPAFRMKAKIIITPKKAVVDPQGKTVQTALAQMGYNNVKAVHVGKYLEIELEGNDKESARKALDDAAHKFLSNPVIEDYKLEIE